MLIKSNKNKPRRLNKCTSSSQKFEYWLMRNTHFLIFFILIGVWLIIIFFLISWGIHMESSNFYEHLQDNII